MSQSLSSEENSLLAAAGVTFNGTSGDDNIFATADDDVINGQAGDDVLNGHQGNDTLHGHAGKDQLAGADGDDILDGGVGRDTLYGGNGSDTYLFGLGSGRDVIYNQQYDDAADRVLLGAGIATDGVTLRAVGNDLVLTITGTEDSLRMLDHFVGAFAIDSIEFADGTLWNQADIQARIQATEGKDGLHGTAGADTMDGLGGDDLLNGYAGNDTLNGGAGGDDLAGGDGNDTLIGGAGRDDLDGGGGNDTYLFDLGSGRDTLRDAAGVADQIVLGAGIAVTDVSVRRAYSELVLTINGTGDSLSVLGVQGIESIRFADGTVWSAADILANAQIGNGEDIFFGTAGNDAINGLGGNDHLYGGYGHDTLNGGKGDDNLYGGYGHDTFDGGEGDDYLSGDYGNDTYLFGRGSGNDRVSGSAGADRVVLQAGIDVDDVTLRADRFDLTLVIKDTADSLKFEYFFYEGNEIESIVFADGTAWNTADILANIVATEGDDFLRGSAGRDVIDGLGGNDVLYGKEGNDTLNGGAGDDHLYGEAGDDTYLFNGSSGQDTIYDEAGGTDRIVLGNGITTDDVALSRSQNSLILKIDGASATLEVSAHFSGYPERGINSIQFADGTVWDPSDIRTHLRATELDDTLTAGFGDDVLAGLDGKDRLFGNRGNDTLNGDNGGDYLFGGPGDDLLWGGAGNDRMFGLAGDDTYLFGIGDGQDRINNKEGGTDRILLGEGITADDITLGSYGDDLILGIDGTNDRLTVVTHFWHSRQMDIIEFADGTVWDAAAILAHVPSTVGDDILHGTAGADRFGGRGGNDVLYGNAGDDTLAGEAGDDTLDGGAGRDILSGGYGNDTFLFGLGSGRDTIYSIDFSGVDRILLGPGITADEVTLSAEDHAVVLKIKGTQDSVSVYISPSYADHVSMIDAIEFDDGTVWNMSSAPVSMTGVKAHADAADAFS